MKKTSFIITLITLTLCFIFTQTHDSFAVRTDGETIEISDKDIPQITDFVKVEIDSEELDQASLGLIWVTLFNQLKETDRLFCRLNCYKNKAIKIASDMLEELPKNILKPLAKKLVWLKDETLIPFLKKIKELSKENFECLTSFLSKLPIKEFFSMVERLTKLSWHAFISLNMVLLNVQNTILKALADGIKDISLLIPLFGKATILLTLPLWALCQDETTMWMWFCEDYPTGCDVNRARMDLFKTFPKPFCEELVRHGIEKGYDCIDLMKKGYCHVIEPPPSDCIIDRESLSANFFGRDIPPVFHMGDMNYTFWPHESKLPHNTPTIDGPNYWMYATIGVTTILCLVGVLCAGYCCFKKPIDNFVEHVIKKIKGNRGGQVHIRLAHDKRENGKRKEYDDDVIDSFESVESSGSESSGSSTSFVTSSSEDDVKEVESLRIV